MEATSPALHLVEFALDDEPTAPPDWPRYPRIATFNGADRTMGRFPPPPNRTIDQKIAAVEEDVWQLESRIDDIQGDVASIQKRVEELPETLRLVMEQVADERIQHEAREKFPLRKRSFLWLLAGVLLMRQAAWLARGGEGRVPTGVVDR